MSNRYNNIPGACHFLPFSCGNESHFQFSYTHEKMYCKHEFYVADTFFSYVESRPLEKDEKIKLDEMTANDYLGPMHLFGNLERDQRAHEKLDGLLYACRLSVSNAADLEETLGSLESGSDEHLNIDADLALNQASLQEELKQINQILDSFNLASGYDAKLGIIRLQRNNNC